jgi:hypothetical protein
VYYIAKPDSDIAMALQQDLDQLLEAPDTREQASSQPRQAALVPVCAWQSALRLEQEGYLDDRYDLQ